MSKEIKNTEEQLGDTSQQSQQNQFRGCAIHIAENGKYGIELVGVKVLEAYAALTLVLERMQKDLIT